MTDGHGTLDIIRHNTGKLTDLFHNGDNITVEPGTYNITLTITQPTGPTEAGSCTLVKN